MRLIKENGLNILKADENKLLKVIGDDYKPQIKDEEGNIIEEEYIPYTTDTVYLGKIYNFDTETIILTISAIATCVGAITGISNVNYNKNNK